MPLLIIIAIVFALVVAVYAGWIGLAALIRLLPMIICYWAAAFAIALVAGVAFGALVPWRALSGRSAKQLRNLDPDLVHAGKAFSAKQTGPSSGYGWDRAWPMYFPYQARTDAGTVLAHARSTQGDISAWFAGKVAARPPATGAQSSAEPKKMRSRIITRWIPGFLAFAVLIAPYLGITCGLWLAIFVWWLLWLVGGGVLRVVQATAVVGHRWVDKGLRRRRRASLRCPEPDCAMETTVPSYQCSNPDCEVVHRTLLPGPLGVFGRRCACGTRLPATVRGASARLVPQCPTCDTELSQGSGNRQTIQVPVIGTMGVGKTRFLAAATWQLRAELTSKGGTLQPLTAEARTYLDGLARIIEQRADTAKTPVQLASGIPLLGRTPNGFETEIQLMDTSGESFTGWESSGELRYLAAAKAYIYIVDPLTDPDIARQLKRKGPDRKVTVADDDDHDTAFGSAFDQMRSGGIDLARRSLAVVFSKADALCRLPAGEALTPDSDSVRAWALDNGFEHTVSRCEQSFKTVKYFLVDAMTDRAPTDPMSAWLPLQWLLSQYRSPLALQPSKQLATAGTN